MAEHSAESDAWGERPEDVLLCLDVRCCLPYGHSEPCDIPPEIDRERGDES